MMEPGTVDVRALTPIKPEMLRQLQVSGDLFNGVVTEHVKSLLQDASFKAKVVQLVNDAIDIPIISEGMEGQLFSQAYDWVVVAVIAGLSKID